MNASRALVIREQARRVLPQEAQLETDLRLLFLVDAASRDAHHLFNSLVEYGRQVSGWDLEDDELKKEEGHIIECCSALIELCDEIIRSGVKLAKRGMATEATDDAKRLKRRITNYRAVHEGEPDTSEEAEEHRNAIETAIRDAFKV